jgi:hypothetical protein
VGGQPRHLRRAPRLPGRFLERSPPVGRSAARRQPGIFGAAYAATVIGRGQRPTLRGGAVVAGSAAAIYAGWALAIMAPAWLIVWIAAALAGFVTGLLRPLPR